MNLLNSLSSRISFSKDTDNTWIVNELQCSLIRVGKNRISNKEQSRQLQFLPQPPVPYASPCVAGSPCMWHLLRAPVNPRGCTQLYGGWCCPSPFHTPIYLGQCKVRRKSHHAAASHARHVQSCSRCAVPAFQPRLGFTRAECLTQWIIFLRHGHTLYKSDDVSAVMLLNPEILLTAGVTHAPFLPAATKSFGATYLSAQYRTVPSAILLK